ncbi:hypothetical protein GCM10009592_14720 [Brachybacterium rhamnosum]|uniref:Pyocin knob domain-containing protein n=1 Tax=Brachybacterium rhamnosum TaxID=173361 RepID=A0ABW4PXT0_9MICO
MADLEDLAVVIAQDVTGLANRVSKLDTPINILTTHIDTLTTPCTFIQSNDSRATEANGYPPVPFGGYGVVTRWGLTDNALLMRYYPRVGPAAKRQMYNGTWSVWTAMDGGPLPAWTTANNITPSYDSGVRNVAQALLGAYTSATSNCSLQRLGNLVEFNLYVRQFDKAGAPVGTTLFTLPAGFRPRVAYRIATTAPTLQISVLTSGAVQLAVGEITVGQYVTFNLSHLTGNAAPSAASLPGSAG